MHTSMYMLACYEHKHLSVSQKCQHKDETETMMSCSESQEIASSSLHRFSFKVKIICLMSLYLAAFLRNAYSLLQMIAFHILSGWQSYPEVEARCSFKILVSNYQTKRPYSS